MSITSYIFKSEELLNLGTVDYTADIAYRSDEELAQIKRFEDNGWTVDKRFIGILASRPVKRYESGAEITKRWRR